MFDMIYRNAGRDKNTPPCFSDGENIIDWLLTNHSVIGRTVSSWLHVGKDAGMLWGDKSFLFHNNFVYFLETVKIFTNKIYSN